jgi:glucose/arabinose dehydrogenase
VDAGVKITHLTHAGDGSGRLFLLERGGRIRVIKNGRLLNAPFLDITSLVDSLSIEQGLLGLAFDPEYADNGIFYIYYINEATDNDTIIARYRVSSDPDRADPDSAEQILFLEQPANNHNGGMLFFGQDGYLYVGLGDGGSGGDPWGNAQNPAILLGKILRLDVRSQPAYAIPPDNPFVGVEGTRPEIYASGLRNPWRFTFDPATGDLYVTDVGESLWEEVNFLPAGASAGANFGWNVLEGAHCYQPATGCDAAEMVPPVYEYAHGEAGCSVIGGYVYRGARYPELLGTYFFGDFCTGMIRAMRRDAAGNWQVADVLDTTLAIVSFGEDEDGELFVLDLEGGVYALSVPAAATVP